MFGIGWMTRDLRDGLRRLSKRPRFTLFAAGILALGVTASTAVFSYVNAYSRSYPGVATGNLYQVWFATDRQPWGAVSYPDFQDLLQLDGPGFSITGIGASSFAATVRQDRFTEVARGASVAPRFFSLLGIAMAAGRGFSVTDHLPGAEPTTILSHDYWGSRYGADPNVLGQTILLNNEAYTIVGVAGPEFLGANAAERPQFWLPFEQFLRVYRARSDTRLNREAGSVIPIVRVSAGTTITPAEDAIRTFATRLDAEIPLSENARRFVLQPATWITPGARDAEASTTRIMMAAAGFLLLLACANVANLILSDGARRNHEMAIRRALGASSGQLVRQLLSENLLLAVPAAVAALALAWPIGNRLSSYFARPSVWGANVPREIVVDPRVILFALAVTVASGVITGLVPAWRASVRNPADAFKPRGASSPARPKRRWLPGTRHALVSLQVAIAMMLLFVAALVLRTLESAWKVEAGFDTDQTIASYVSTSSMGVPIPERHRFFEGLIERFMALSWVEAATVAENAPLSGHPTDRLLPPDGGDPVPATIVRAWPGYFETLGMELLRGRFLTQTDTIGTTPVVVVNETLASRLSRGGDVLGRALDWPGGEQGEDNNFEIVGIIRDATQISLLDPPDPVAYFSLRQLYSRPGNALMLKVRGDPAGAVNLMEQELRSVDTRLAIVNIIPYRAVVRGALYTQRMNAELFTVIAFMGLVLAAAGVFAVVELAVLDGRREIGIRMAIGGGAMSITRSVAGPVGSSVMLGLVIGFAGAFAATRVVTTLLWGVAPRDPVALGVGAAVLSTVILLALAIPLRRAMEVDPANTLRAQ